MVQHKDVNVHVLLKSMVSCRVYMFV